MAHSRAKGTALKIKVNTTYTAVSQVENIDFQRQRDTIETTNHDTTDLDREYIGGLANATVSAAVSWDPADTEHEALEDAYASGDLTDFQIVYPDASGTTYQFSGVLTSFSTPAPVDGKMMANIEIQVSGSIVKDPE